MDEPISKKDLELINYKLENMSSKIEYLTRELKNSDDRYVRRSEFNSFKEDEFKPIKSYIEKVNWKIVSTVLLAVLSLVVVVGSKLVQ